MPTGFSTTDVSSTETAGKVWRSVYVDGKDAPQFLEEQPTLKLEALRAKAKQLSKEAAARPNDRGLRMEANYAAALWRDALAGTFRRRALQGMGAHNNWRILYETAKIHFVTHGS